MNAPSPFFVAGGSLPPDAPSYVERPADATLFERVQRNELCYLLTPRRSGKSSLLLRLRERLRSAWVRVAYVDLTMLGTGATADEWFYGFCRAIARELDVVEAFEAWWPAVLGLPPTQRMTECLRDFFLPLSSQPLLVMVDEIETTRRLAWGDDFLTAIRACFNARAQDEVFEHLNFVLAGVSTPADLIRDPNRTPFNVGFRVELTDFSLQDAAGLAAGLGVSCSEPEKVLEEILSWTGGHPYLTQRLCKSARDKGVGPGEVDALVEAELLSEEARGREDHFKFVRERVSSGGRSRPVLALYGKVLAGRAVEVDPRSPVHDALRLSDLVKVEVTGRLVPRNRILATVFDHKFVRRARRWSRQQLAAAGSVASVVVTALVFLLAVQPRTFVQAIDAAVTDPPALAYERLRATPFWGRVGNEHFARFFDRRAMKMAQEGDRDRALLDALQADSLSSTPRRRAQVAALYTGDLELLERTFRHCCAVNAVAFSPDGERVLAGGSDYTARLWDARTGEPVGAPMRHATGVQAVTFSAAGDRILTGSRDGAVMEWHARTGDPGRVRLPPTKGGDLVALSPGGERALVFDAYQGFRIWDTTTGLLLSSWDGYPRPVSFTFAFRPDGDPFVWGGGRAFSRLTGSTGRFGREAFDLLLSVMSLAFSPNGKQLLTGSIDGTVQLRDANSLVPIGASLQHQESVAALAFSPDGQWVAAGGSSGGTRLWSAWTGQPRGEFLAHQRGVTSLAFSPDGGELFTASADGTARLWRVEGGQGPDARPSKRIAIRALTLSPDGRTVATVGEDSSVHLWDATTARPLGSALRHEGEIRDVAFSPDGARVLTASEDGTARLWNAETGEALAVPMQHQGAVTGVAFSPDGLRILTGSEDRTARLWNALTGQPLTEPMEHSAPVATVTFSPDGARALTTSEKGAVHFWDAHTGQALGEPVQHLWAVYLATFGPGGDRVLTVSADRAMRLWDVQTRQALGSPLQDELSVRSVAFSQDGQTFLTGGAAVGKPSSGETRIWSARTGQALGAAIGHSDPVRKIAFGLGERTFWSVTGTTVFHWALDPTGARLLGSASCRCAGRGVADSLRIDPNNPDRIRLVEIINGAPKLRVIDLSTPPADFTHTTDELLRTLPEKFGLELRDWKWVLPYELPAGEREKPAAEPGAER